MRIERRTWQGLQEEAISKGLFLCALVTVATTLGIILTLATESFVFFSEVSLSEFFGKTEWRTLHEPRSFGIWPLIVGTCQIAVGAAVVAVPLGLGIAVYLAEYASAKARSFLKPILEILAGIPTVVYGYFAVTTITPLLKQVFPTIQVFNALSASIVVGIMILPMIASLSDDALRAVPRALKDGGYALGATKLEVIRSILLPAAWSGVVASFILAISRAIGETMAVTLAAGATPNMSFDFLGGIQTMTAYIVQVSLGDAPHGTIEYNTIFAVALTLFVMTLMFNILAQYVVKRFGRKYE